MATYILTTSLRHDGEDYSTGDAIELTDAEANAFREREWITDGDTPAKTKPEKTRRGKAAPATAAKNVIDAKPVK